MRIMVSTKDKFKKFIKFHWIKILVISLIAVIFVLAVILMVVGVQNFLSLESFYKKMTLANLPLQFFMGIITAFVFAGVYMGFSFYFFYGGGFAKMGQKRIKSSEVNIHWKDVVGMENIKKEVFEVIKLIKDRAVLKQAGGEVIRGVLMVGPPGCGKTYLAKAIATETGLPFLASVGSEFMGVFVGVGSSRIRSLFKQARILADIHGGCIIFIDEIDTIARPRVSVGGWGAGMDYNATVNQLLTELDGLRQSKDTNIVVIAATNVPEDELDQALMRAGRFDRKIYVTRPNLEDRKKLFEYYLNKVSVSQEVNTDILARRTVWFSAADIANMVKEAALVSVRNQHKEITNKDLSEAYDRVMFGLKSNITLTDKEKKWTAYHEAGHAIIAYLTHPTDDVVKASIIPRKSALGFVGHRSAYEVYAPDKNWYLANIKTSLGGYAAEKIVFNSTTAGVDSDLASATALAHDMVWRWGMGPSGLIGNFQILASSKGWQENSHAISERTREKLDGDVQKIVNDCYKEVENILTQERGLLEVFARSLFEKEELEYDEIEQIFKEYGKEKPADSTSF